MRVDGQWAPGTKCTYHVPVRKCCPVAGLQKVLSCNDTGHRVIDVDFPAAAHSQDVKTQRNSLFGESAHRRTELSFFVCEVAKRSRRCIHLTTTLRLNYSVCAAAGKSTNSTAVSRRYNDPHTTALLSSFPFPTILLFISLIRLSMHR